MAEYQGVEIKKIPAGQSGLTKKQKSRGRYQSIEIEPVAVADDWIARHWYIFTTRNMRVTPTQKCVEVQAHEALAELGITSWYPVRKEHVNGRSKRRNKHGKVVRNVNRLLFPGYLMVAHSANFRKALDLKQISGMIGYESSTGGFVPVRVPSVAMQALFAGDEIRNGGLQEGESIEVIEGPFASFDGPINKIISADRIEIVLDFMGSERPVEISVDKIRRL